MNDNVQTRGFVSRLSSFTGQPFSTQMDLTGWFLFVGLLFVAAFIWTRVLNVITEHVR